MTTKLITRSEKLQALRLNFISQLPGMMEQLVVDATGGGEASPDPQALARAQRQAHTLAGTAGTFGLMEIYRDARELEELFVSSLQAGRAPESGLLRLRVEALQAAVHRVLLPRKAL